MQPTLHVLTDAAISVPAILGLGAGKFLGWIWMDPVMGLVGAAVVAQWAYVLARQTGGLLLDQTPPPDLLDEIRTAVESDGNSAVADLHVWCVGEHQFTAIVSVVTAGQRPPDEYKVRLQEHAELVHVTIEVNRCNERVHTRQTDAARHPIP